LHFVHAKDSSYEQPFTIFFSLLDISQVSIWQKALILKGIILPLK